MKYSAAKYHPSILSRIVVLYAQFHSSTEIREKIKAEFGVEVSNGYVKSYVLRPGTAVHTKMLSLREQYCKDVMSVSVSQKVVRLRELEKIIAHNRGKTDRDSVNAVLRALAEARAEVEGSKVIQLFQFNKYEGVTDDQLRTKRIDIVRQLARAEGLDLPISAFARVGADRRGVADPAEQVQAEVLHSESDSVLLSPVEGAD